MPPLKPKKNKKMIKHVNVYICILSLLVGHNMLSGQQLEKYNPRVSNSQITLTDHEKGMISFDFVLEASDYSLTEGSKPIQLSACMMNAKLTTQSMGQLSGDSRFAWSSNDKGDCLYARQQASITGDEVLSFEVPVQVVAASPGGGADLVGVMLNIQPAPIMNASNDRSDDALFYARAQADLHSELATKLEAKREQSGELAMSLSIYPNPSSDFVKIQLNRTLSDARVVMVDLSGRVIMQQQYALLLEATIDLSPIGSGRYEVLIQSDHLEQDLTQSVIVSK